MESRLFIEKLIEDRMDFKKYFSFLVCSFVILGLFLFTGYNLVEAYANVTLNSDTKLTASSTCKSYCCVNLSL